MQPRALFRTHYQVDEPALMEFLVKFSTSPVRSAYDESVAEKLAKEVQKRGKAFNVAAGGYALDLARGLGLVNDQNVWTDKGHLVNLVAEVGEGTWEEQLDLRPPEKILHLRLFLEADGAALLFLARALLEHGRLPNSDGDWNQLAKQLFVEIYSEYLEIAGTTADRVSLRMEVERIRSRGYTGKSGPHKMFIHLQTLFRLGLVERAETAAARHYSVPRGDGVTGLQTLVDEMHDLYELERMVKERRLVEVASRALNLAEGTDGGGAAVDILSLVMPVYTEVMSTGVPLCPLATIIEAIQIDLVARESRLVSYRALLDHLQDVQKARMGEIRFHVDRRGEPAFLKLSDQLLLSSPDRRE